MIDKYPFLSKLPVGWQLIKFSDLIMEKLNGIYKKKEFHGRGTKIINMGELFGYDFISNQEMKRLELNNKEKSKYLVKDGDLLFARRSLVLEGSGKCSLIVNPQEETTFESSIILTRVDKTKVYPKFLFYLFTSSIGRALMASIASQTAVSGITGSNLIELLLPVPPLPTQQKIAGILSAYDDLIENNTRRIEILEEMARMLYREWFVKFRFPVDDGSDRFSDGGDRLGNSRGDRLGNGRGDRSDNESDRFSDGGDRSGDGKGDRSGDGSDRSGNESDRLGNGRGDRSGNESDRSDDIRGDRSGDGSDRLGNGRGDRSGDGSDRLGNGRGDRFSDGGDRSSNNLPELVESELGLIPKGWEVVTLKNLIKLTHGYAFKSSQFSTDPTPYIVIRMGNITENGGLQVEKNIKYIEYSSFKEKYLLSPNDLVMAFSDVTRSGGIIGNVALIPDDKNQ